MVSRSAIPRSLRPLRFKSAAHPTAGNLISGNGKNGVEIDASAEDTAVLGNTIGLDVSGIFVQANLGDGVQSFALSTTIGGTDPGAGNLISGNFGDGIAVLPTTVSGSSAVILGNEIGVNVTGTTDMSPSATPMGNGADGIVSDAATTIIGGTTTAARNLISGNLGNGITLGTTVITAVIQGNSFRAEFPAPARGEPGRRRAELRHGDNRWRNGHRRGQSDLRERRRWDHPPLRRCPGHVCIDPGEHHRSQRDGRKRPEQRGRWH